MKIEIEVDNLKLMFNGLNNALYLYGDDIFAKELCCKSNDKLSKIPLEELKRRRNELKKFYNNIYEKYKNEIDN